MLSFKKQTIIKIRKLRSPIINPIAIIIYIIIKLVTIQSFRKSWNIKIRKLRSEEYEPKLI